MSRWIKDALPVKKYKILIALQRYESGGAERQALYLAQGLQQRGYNVTVLAFGNEEGLALRRFKDGGIHAIATGFNERLILDEPANLKARFLKWKYTRNLIMFIRSLAVDVIFPFTYPPNVLYGTLWKRMGARACYWNQRDEGRLFMGRCWERKALENCTRIISNSLEGKLFLQRFITHTIEVIHNGIDVSRSGPLKDGSLIKVVMVANLHKHKDHLTLLRAWKRIQVKITSGTAVLYLAGKELNAFKDITDYIEQNNLSDSVTCLGEVSDVALLLSEAHIGVFSSFNEGLPNGILECMASGLPVVANRILGAEELLGNEYPFLFNTGDDERMSDFLFDLIMNPTLRETVGEINLLRVQEKFSKEVMLDKYEKLIKTTIHEIS